MVPIEDDLVILDIDRDRYACLAGVAQTAQPDAARRRLRVFDDALGGELRRAGFTTSRPARREPWRAPPTPISTAAPLDIEAPRWRDLVDMMRATSDLLWTYRGRPLSDLLQQARAGVPPAASVAREGLETVVSRFHRWIPFAPVSAKCLLRAFMLLRLLQREGQDARWIFGVATRPFEAHCWLQVGGLVLDDDADRVAAFHPILVV